MERKIAKRVKKVSIKSRKFRMPYTKKPKTIKRNNVSTKEKTNNIDLINLQEEKRLKEIKAYSEGMKLQMQEFRRLWLFFLGIFIGLSTSYLITYIFEYTKTLRHILFIIFLIIFLSITYSLLCRIYWVHKQIKFSWRLIKRDSKIVKKRMPYLHILLVVFLLSLAIVYYYDYEKDDYIPFQKINGLQLDGNIPIRNLEIYHRLSDNNGYIQFYVDKQDYNSSNHDDIYIYFPVEITRNEISIELNNSIISKDFKNWSLEKDINNNSRIRLENIPEPLNSDTYTITYQKFIPTTTILNYDIYTQTKGRVPKISFNLGKKYVCAEPCIEKSNNLDEARTNTEREKTFKPNGPAPANYYVQLSTKKNIRNSEITYEILKGIIIFVIGLLIDRILQHR